LLVAGTLLVLLALWGGVRPDDVWRVVEALPARAFAAAVGVHAGVYVLRAWRYRVLVPPEVRPPFAHVLAAASAHNLATYVLPARTGDASLVLYLRRSGGLPAAEGLATLVVSRVLDLASLAAAMAAACAGLGRADEDLAWLAPAGGGLALVALALFGLSARARWFADLARVALRIARLDRTGPGRRAVEIAERVAGAFAHCGRDGRLSAAILLSFPQWLGIFAFYAILATGLGVIETGDVPRAIFGSGLAILSNLLPVNMFAGFGTQEAGWVLGYGILGVPRDVALATGVGVHLVQLFDVCLFGLAAHVMMGWLRPVGARGSSAR
jgi:hypothetical protein